MCICSPGCLHCADCKRAMERVVVKKKNGKCMSTIVTPIRLFKRCLHQTHHYGHEIQMAVLQTIQGYSQLLLNFEKVLKELDYKKHRRNQADNIDKRLVQMKMELGGIEHKSSWVCIRI